MVAEPNTRRKRKRRNPFAIVRAAAEDAGTNGAATLDLSALLDVLGYGSDEFVSIAHKGRQRGDEFTTTVTKPSRVKTILLELLGQEYDIWFGVNPTSGPARTAAGRGKTPGHHSDRGVGGRSRCEG
jgi:hypothetical protein